MIVTKIIMFNESERFCFVFLIVIIELLCQWRRALSKIGRYQNQRMTTNIGRRLKKQINQIYCGT